MFWGKSDEINTGLTTMQLHTLNLKKFVFIRVNSLLNSDLRLSAEICGKIKRQILYKGTPVPVP
jgi:hypothetical protein